MVEPSSPSKSDHADTVHSLTSSAKGDESILQALKRLARKINNMPTEKRLQQIELLITYSFKHHVKELEIVDTYVM